jgi:hypothetical protein
MFRRLCVAQQRTVARYRSGMCYMSYPLLDCVLEPYTFDTRFVIMLMVFMAVVCK